MKFLAGIALLAFTTLTDAQQDCKPEATCAVTFDPRTGHSTATPASSARALPSKERANRVGNDPDSPYTQRPASEVLSLEEAAITYFDHVAKADASYPGGGKPFDPNNVMWDRGSLTDGEAAEVLEVARRQKPPDMPRGDAEKSKKDHRQMCEQLAAAKTADDQAAAFEQSASRAAAREKAAGKKILDQLSAGTRESVLEVISSFRDDIHVNRMDWKKMAATKPETLAAHSQRACADVTGANSRLGT